MASKKRRVGRNNNVYRQGSTNNANKQTSILSFYKNQANSNKIKEYSTTKTSHDHTNNDDIISLSSSSSKNNDHQRDTSLANANANDKSNDNNETINNSSHCYGNKNKKYDDEDDDSNDEKTDINSEDSVAKNNDNDKTLVSINIIEINNMADERHTEEQNEQEQEQQQQLLYDTRLPSASTSTSTSSSHDDGLCEYEKLRLRNIARNNARLATLGLLSSSSSSAVAITSSRTSSKSRPSRKKPKICRQGARRKQPIIIRRSSRNRNSSINNTNKNNIMNGTDNGIDFDNGGDSAMKQEEQIEEECYTTSPLVQYEMTSHRNNNIINSNNNRSKDNIYIDTLSMKAVSSSSCPSSSNCLVVKGPRFIPPKGLNAIYSLDFWEHNKIINDSNNTSRWLVGAGKAGMIALWDTNKTAAIHTSTSVVDDTMEDNSNGNVLSCVDPVLSWKSHSGRWIADAKFIPGPITSSIASNDNNNGYDDASSPSRLITAGNDGSVCLWDLSTVSVLTGIPKLLHRTGKSLHSSGIFCMDVAYRFYNTNNNDLVICTGSKDKSIAISSLESLTNATGTPLWRSQYHSAKVGSISVKLQSATSFLLASASDDGSVAIHDYRMDGGKSSSSSFLVAKIEDAHNRPHSVLWDPHNDMMFATAGLDPIIKFWDQRNLSKPLSCLQGHVPTGIRCKKIHRPTFFYPGGKGIEMMTSLDDSSSEKRLPWIDGSPFLLTGGQGSASISMYQTNYDHLHKNSTLQTKSTSSAAASLCSRGKLPRDCGDAGCIAVNGSQVAVTVNQGEIIILEAPISSM